MHASAERIGEYLALEHISLEQSSAIDPSNLDRTGKRSTAQVYIEEARRVIQVMRGILVTIYISHRKSSITYETPLKSFILSSCCQNFAFQTAGNIHSVKHETDQ